ncbi:uncharacterized protein [Centruroides vittatus]|uniref:uncharacterized protein n=1 Tax=Centruroides vittatus TaxID=120091 RepID=UPI00350FACE5
MHRDASPLPYSSPINLPSMILCSYRSPIAAQVHPACLPTFCPILSGACQDPWAITLVPNTNLTVMHHAKHSNEHIVATEIDLNDERIVILNIYFPGGVDSESYLQNLQDTIDAFNGTHLIVGDINAHSPAWGGEDLDGLGGLFEEFLHRNNLLLLNNSMSPSPILMRTLLDRCVYLQLWRKYDPIRANWACIKEFLETNLIYSPEQNETRTQIDYNLEIIRKAWIPTFPRRALGEEEPPGGLRRSRHRNASDHHIHKEAYLSSLRAYKQTIKAEKLRKWHEFCTITSRDPWGYVTKTCMGRLRKVKILTDNNNSNTPLNIAQTMLCHLDSFCPADDPETDTEWQGVIRADRNRLADTIDTPPSSEGEINKAILTLGRRKAPGVDEINTDIVHAIFPKTWKRARVVPVPKANSTTDIRPISLLPILGKILEKLIKFRLEWQHVEHNHCLSDTYRVRLSTDFDDRNLLKTQFIILFKTFSSFYKITNTS